MINHNLPQRCARAVRDICTHYPIVRSVADWAAERGGSAYLVGGTVRDIILGAPMGDVDVEVHGVTLAELQNKLSEFGTVMQVGKSFGVLKSANLPIDWSIPRSDGTGRKPEVTLQPNITIEDALRRRDLTMNAMALRITDGMLIDPFHGIRDMEQRTLRAPDAQLFVQDPLRFFRVMHFSARFDMHPDDELNRICQSMSLAGLSHERIANEFDKMLRYATAPARGFRWLAQIGRLCEITPELARTEGLLQNPAWHPEGDVFEHTMQALDAAAAIARRESLPRAERTVLLWAATCHDLGKQTTTKCEHGILRSHGHAEAGVPLARALLERLTLGREGHDAILALVRWHMAPGLYAPSSVPIAKYKILAHRLAPTTNLRMLGLLAEADKRGRNQHRGDAPLPEPVNADALTTFRRRATEAGVINGPEQPLLTGADFMEQGIESGAELGALLKRAYEIQLERGIAAKKELLKLALETVRVK